MVKNSSATLKARRGIGAFRTAGAPFERSVVRWFAQLVIIPFEDNLSFIGMPALPSMKATAPQSCSVVSFCICPRITTKGNLLVVQEPTANVFRS